MPTANVNDTTLHYRFDGPEDAPVLLVSNSLASNLGMWDHQIDSLLRPHLTRYYGVFAPNFQHRRRIIPSPARHSAREPHASRRAPMSWMQRLKRVLRVDIEHCGVCGATLRVIACIDTPEVIERILTHLAARKARRNNRPRAPPLHVAQAQPPASPSLPPS